MPSFNSGRGSELLSGNGSSRLNMAGGSGLVSTGGGSISGWQRSNIDTPMVKSAHVLLCYSSGTGRKNKLNPLWW